MVAGEIGLSLLDFGARRLSEFDEDVLLVSVPFHRMSGIMRALDQGLGGERTDLADIEQQIGELGVVEPV